MSEAILEAGLEPDSTEEICLEEHERVISASYRVINERKYAFNFQLCKI